MLDPNWLVGAGAILTAVLALVGVVYSVRKNLRSTEGKDRYDQLQEDLDAERATRIAQVAQLMAQIESQGDEIRVFKSDVRIRDDYIQVLRRHIELRKSPPPPPYPSAMNAD